MIKNILIALVVHMLILGVAFADEKWETNLVLNTTAKHFDAVIDYDFNEDNRGLGVEYNYGSHFIALGGYVDSFSTDSYYASYGQKFNIVSLFGVDLDLGYSISIQSRSMLISKQEKIWTHYNSTYRVEIVQVQEVERRLLGWILPIASIHTDDIGVNVIVCPQITVGDRVISSSGFVFFQTTVNLD